VKAGREADRRAKEEAKLTPEEKKKRSQKEKRQRRSADQRRAGYEKQERERTAEEEADANAAAEAMEMLVERFSQDELQHFVELMSRRSHWAIDTLQGKSPLYASKKASSILEPWLGYLKRRPSAEPVKGQELVEQRTVDARKAIVSAMREMEPAEQIDFISLLRLQLDDLEHKKTGAARTTHARAAFNVLSEDDKRKFMDSILPGWIEGDAS
jgi:hypothetical protein